MKKIDIKNKFLNIRFIFYFIVLTEKTIDAMLNDASWNLWNFNSSRIQNCIADKCNQFMLRQIFCAVQALEERHRVNVGAGGRQSWQHDVNRPCVIFERGLDRCGACRWDRQLRKTARQRRRAPRYRAKK